MTTEEAVFTLLLKKGMDRKDAQAVIEAVKKEMAKDEIAVQWQANVNGYENFAFGPMWIYIEGIALKWIDQNKPLAFYRPMFE